MASYLDHDWGMSAIESVSSPNTLTQINVRKTPFLSGGVVSNFFNFNPIRVSKHTYANDGHDWYRIENASGVGYVSSKVVTIVPVKTPSAETRYIIDLHPDTIIVSESELPIVQAVFRSFAAFLINRVDNPTVYEESE